MNKIRLFVTFICLIVYTCEDPSLSQIDQAGSVQTSGMDLIIEDMGGESSSGTELHDQELMLDQELNDSFLHDSGITDSSLIVDMEQSIEDMDLSCGDQSSCPEPLSCISSENEEWCACPIGYTIDETGETCLEVSCPTNAGSWPNCSCLAGFEGDLYFDINQTEWIGDCLPIGRECEPNETQEQSCGLGICQTTTVVQCIDWFWEACQALPSNGTDDDCDGLDNDCDGSVDESYQGNSTTCGIGACQRNGSYVCVNAQEVDNCQPGPINIEIANNGIDEDCDGQDLSYSWQTSGWGACDANATWSTGAWSSCSSACGSGNQTRTVSCTSDTGSETRNVSCVDNYGNTVADHLCSGVKPTSTRSCTDTNCDQAQPSSSRSCSEYSYSWSTSAWSACNANATYTTGAWGGCSTACGSGTQSRTVSCQSDTGTQTRSASCLRCDGQSVNGSLCGSSPSTSRSCTDSTCSGTEPSSTRTCEEYTYNLSIGSWGSCSANATWSTGSWGSCSSTCEGTQSRSVTCSSDTGTESRTVSCTRCDGAQVAQSACGTNHSTSRTCTDTSCDGPQPANSQPCSGGQCPCAFASYGPSGAVCSGGPANHGQTMGTCSEGGTCSATCNNGTWQANHYGCFANPTYTWSEIQAFNYGLLDDPNSCVEPLPRTPMCTSGAGSACSSNGAKCKDSLECSDGAYYVLGRICQ